MENRKEKTILLPEGRRVVAWRTDMGLHLTLEEPNPNPKMDGPLGYGFSSVFDVILVETGDRTMEVLSFAGMTILVSILDEKVPQPEFRVDLPTWEKRRAFLPTSCWRALEIRSRDGEVILTPKTRKPQDGGLGSGGRFRNLASPITVKMVRDRIVSMASEGEEVKLD